MHKTRIPSPARSLGAPRTPRRYKPRASRSLCSPTRSSPPRTSSAFQQSKENDMDSFVVSPLKRRQSVLSNNTDVPQPQRKSWWKKLDDNSRDVIELLDKNKIVENVNNVEEIIDYEVLSQEKKDYTWDPESSGCESIRSVVLPQRKLFNVKESQPQSNFGQFVGNESLAKLYKTNIAPEDNTINVRSKNLFPQVSKQRKRPRFPSALLSLSPNKTANTTKEFKIPEVQGQVRNLYGNRPVNKPNNMFADFFSSGSEDDVSEIRVRSLNFQKKIEQKRRGSSTSHGLGDTLFSVDNDIEMDDWNLLPSSTMVDNQLEDISNSTPLKKSKASNLTDIKESKAISDNDRIVNKTRQSNKSVSSQNRSEISLRSKDSIQFENGHNTSQLSNRSTSSKNKSKLSSNSLMKLNRNNQEQNNSQTKNVSKNTSHKVHENKDQMKAIHEGTSKILPEPNLDVNEEKNRHQDLFQEKEPSLQENLDHDFYKSVNEHIKISEHQTVNEDTPYSIQKPCNKDKIKEIDIDTDNISETCKGNTKSINNQQKDNKNNYENVANNIQNNIEENNEQEEVLSNDNEVGNEMNISNGDNQKEAVGNEEELENELQKEETPMVGINDTNKQENDNVENNNEMISKSSRSQEQIEPSIQDFNKQKTNTTLNTSAKNQQHEMIVESRTPEAVLCDVTNKNNSFTAQGLNSSMGKTKSIIKHLSFKPSLPNIRTTTEIGSNESGNSTAERSGWDSHRTTRKTLRQTFGKDFTPRKSLRTLVMEKSAKRQTTDIEVNNVEPQIHETFVEPSKTKDTEETDELSESVPQDNTNFSEIKSRQMTMNNEINIETIKSPQANSTEFPQNTNENLKEPENSSCEYEDTVEPSTHTNENLEEPENPSCEYEDTVEPSTHTNENLEEPENPSCDYEDTVEPSTHTNENLEEPENCSCEYEDTVEPSMHVNEISLQRRRALFVEKMQKENMERRRKIEEKVKRSFETPTNYNFIVPTINPVRRPKPKIVKNKAKPIKPWDIPLEQFPQEFIKDMKYKPPKRYAPASAPWITKRLYNFLETKLAPIHDYKARIRAEELVRNIHEFAKLVRRKQIAPPDAVNYLKQEMARLDIVQTHFDFYQFFWDYMPRDIRVKVNPDAVNDLPLPRGGIFADILETSDEE